MRRSGRNSQSFFDRNIFETEMFFQSKFFCELNVFAIENAISWILGDYRGNLYVSPFVIRYTLARRVGAKDTFGDRLIDGRLSLC